MIVRYLFGLAVCLLALNAFPAKPSSRHHANGTEITTAEQMTQPLPPAYGYLLLDLDLGEASPIITIREIVNKNKLSRLPPQLISLKNKGKNFLLLQQREGAYLIQNVNVPLFNLPHRITTDKSKRWRFSIQADKVNYIGRLSIDAERTKRIITVNYSNRLATDLARIQETYTDLLKLYPLAANHGHPDAFYDYLLQLTNNSQSQAN
ncbi:MAG: hypothetical protein COA42_23835 [Alteromonadaceae bacterium]|nr:MAG: hypothetical protein COA42_23835 [Alteromonadaceae bacterium]